MGANAQTAVPAFVAGEVLTAAEMTQVNTGIPVFATTVTRDAAFGGTGEKTLAEGQYAYIEATNTTQYYDGAAWQTVGGGMTLIESNSFSAVSSVSASANVFSSTYNFYRVVFHLTACSANMEIYLRMRAAGTDYTGSNYFYSGAGYVSTSGTSGFSTSGTYQFTGYVTTSSSDLFAYSGDIYNPNVATYTNIVGQSFTSNSAYSGSVGTIQSAGVVRTATQYDAFSFVASTGNFTGRYAIYGYNK